MKDKKVEEEKRGQPNYEHLEEDLHVLLMVEDTEERARFVPCTVFYKKVVYKKVLLDWPKPYKKLRKF